MADIVLKSDDGPKITLSSAPDLKLTLSGGLAGASATATTLAIGSVTTGAPGTAASATISGVAPNQVINLVLPRGTQGTAGPANTISVGSITTGAPGSAASAVLTGTPPNQTLNLVLPAGPAGAGVPTGGDAGQVLAKIDGSNYSTQWITASTGGGSSSPATFSAVGTVYQTEYNVHSYGAVGDGSTNDKTAIQNAINAAHAAGGGIIRFTKPMYNIGSALTLYSNLTFIGTGDGFGVTTLNQTSTSANGMQGVDIINLTIRDMQIQGPGSGTGIGVNLTKSANPDIHYINMENVYISAFGSHGFYASNLIVSTFRRVVMESNGGKGWYLVGVSGSGAGTSVHFDSCYGLANGQSGFTLDTMIYSSFSNCAVDDTGIGYELINCQGIAFVACGSETPANKSTSYPGNAWKISNSAAIGLHNVVVANTLAPAINVINSQVSIYGVAEFDAETGTRYWLSTDSTSVVTVDMPSTYIPVTGTGKVTYLNDGTGSSVFPGPLYLGSTFVDSLNVGYASTTGQVLTAVDNAGNVGWATPTTGGSGTVTSVTSANANATIATGTTTPVITIVSAPKLLTARTVTTNLASTSAASFDGTANITPGVSGTLPIANGGTGNTTGLAATATALAAARTIAGVSFNGTANIALASTNLSDTASIALLTTAQTLTNKRITKRVITATSSATPTPTGDTADIWYLSTQTVAGAFAAPTGTPTDGQQLTIRIKSVAAQTLTWNAIYLSSGVATLPTTTVAGKTITIGLTYDAAQVKWVCLAVDAIGY